MKRTVANTSEENFFLLSSLPPSRAQKRAAFAIVVGMVGIGLTVIGPLSGVKLARIPAFLPMYLMAMFLNDLFTATLLFAQFAISRSLANLVIATGYAFTAAVVIPYSLTFPGVFAPAGVIGGLQSTAWLFDVWHVGFPVFVIGYAFLKDANPAARIWRGKVPVAIALSVASTIVFVATLVVLCVRFEDHSPIIILDSFRFSPLFPYYVGAPVVTACISAVIVLWIRGRSLLDLWLMAVLCLFVVEMPISYYPDPERFSLGWYTARVIGFFDSSLVLIVLLYEITTLYPRLLRSIHAQRREREARLITGDAVAAAIAHEVNQPLAAMITRAETALRWLEGFAPDLTKLRDGIEKIAADGYRAGAIIEGIRASFKKEARTRTSIDVNRLIDETLSLVRDDLQKHRILLEAQPNADLPRVVGDRVQLQQVLLNLITNAMDSMAATDGPRVLGVKSQIGDDGGVVVSIADTGTGISPHAVERLFNPLFTTKAGGMGMGLSICRSIIEAHDGQLSFVPNQARGAVFQFSLRPVQ